MRSHRADGGSWLALLTAPPTGKRGSFRLAIRLVIP